MVAGTFHTRVAHPLRSGARDVLPIVVALIPFGLTIGAVVASARFDTFAGWFAGPWLLAGSAHLAMVDAVDAGAGAVVALSLVLAINARFTAYSAGMISYFSQQPTWFRWVGPVAIIDQTFVLATARTESSVPRWFRSYWLTMTVSLVLAWSILIELGVLLGSVLPPSWNLAYSAPLMFVAIAAPLFRERSSCPPAVAAAVVAVPASNLTAGTGVLVAIAAGVGIGILSEGRGR